jgi:hypothetical protein
MEYDLHMSSFVVKVFGRYFHKLFLTYRAAEKSVEESLGWANKKDWEGTLERGRRNI